MLLLRSSQANLREMESVGMDPHEMQAVTCVDELRKVQKEKGVLYARTILFIPSMLENTSHV